MSNETIIVKLDNFIRKYYKNKLIRGVLYSTILLLSLFILFNIVEYFVYFSSLVRSILFYLYLAFAIFLIIFLIAKPLLKIYKLGKTISYTDAAKIIGDFFPEISDKLLNLLQLQEQSKNTDSDLLEASIEQKTTSLKLIPFVKAINFEKNKKYLKWVAIPVITIILILVFYPSLISDPTNRFINHSKYFEKPAPFSYKLLNKELKVLQHGDIEVRVRIEGKMLPNEVNIVVNKQMFHMKKEKKDEFSFSFKQLQSTTSFYFESADVRSLDYKIEVMPKPILADLQAVITYPAYTGMPEQSFSNVSNFSVPKGSVIKWQAVTKDTRTVIFDFGGKQDKIEPNSNGRLTYVRKILSDVNYKIFTQNEYALYSDSLQFSVSVIPDLSPQIAIIEHKDSIAPERVYFRGQIKDDYGFSKLEFHIEKYEKDKPEKTITKVTIPFNKEEKAQEFYYHYDLNELGIKPGDKVLYYFEVWDNDGVDGAKSTRSSNFMLEMPSVEEIEKKTDKTSEEIKQETSQSISELNKLQQEIKELNKKLLEKKQLDWQDKKQLDEMLKKQQDIKQRLQEISKKINENNTLEQKYKNQDEDIIRKQKELEKLFNEVMTEDMKKMFDELQKMAEKQMDKNKLQESLDKMKMASQDLEKNLDRNLEMYKRLEVDKKMNEAIDKLSELSIEQNKLAEETAKGQKDNTELQKKQDELNKSFENLKKDLGELQQKASQLEEPQEIKRDKEKENSVSQEQNNAKKQLENNNNKGASKSQKSAAEKMQQMSDDLQKQQQDADQDQLVEDVDEVRQILKNLVKLSFNQEALMKNVQQVSVSDPAYQTYINQQNKIKDDMKMINDSLFAMSKRQPQIGTAINKELSIIESQIGKSLDNLLMYNQSIYGSYKNTNVAPSQQYTMTSMNNLALMLAESLDKMQSQMKSSSKSKSNSKPQNSCNNPGSSGQKKSPKNMRQMQEALNKEIDRLRKELEKNKNSNQGKPRIGENAKINEELARTAAQQEMIRKMMQEYAEELKQQEGKANGQMESLLKQMEQTESDIVNKAINQQTIQRQSNILTRMLEHEKAEKKKDQEERRESTEAKDKFDNKNNPLLEFNKLKGRDLELIKQVPPIFSPYYKAKVNDFFYKFEN